MLNSHAHAGNGRAALLTVLFMFALSTFSGTAGAQMLGEVAGKMNFTVVVGSNQTLYLQVFDRSNTTPVSFVTVKPRFQPAAGQPTPSIYVSQLNGTLLPRQTLQIGISVSMPANATPGASWSSVVQFVEVSNQSGSQPGAQTQTGVAKIISATAEPLSQKQGNSTSSGQLSGQSFGLIGVVLAVLAFAGISYYLLGMRRKR